MVRGNYLSVFLELSAGLPETSKYKIVFFHFVFCSKLEKFDFSVQKPYLLN